MYLYLSNDNAALGGNAIEVFFDDFTVQHIKSPVVQQDDYYAFGLNFNSYRRENSTANQYLYNGKERQDELDLGWYDYQARQYDPAIARWFVVDPLSEVARRWSVYQYCYSNPLRFIDPDGMLVDDYYGIVNNELVFLGSDGRGDGMRFVSEGSNDAAMATLADISKNGTATDSQIAALRSPDVSQTITFNEDNIQKELQDVNDRSIGSNKPEQSAIITFDPSTATVDAQKGAEGNNDIVVNKVQTYEGSRGVWTPDGKLVVGIPHSHPTKRGREREKGYSVGDSKEQDDADVPMYAIDSSQAAVGSPATIHAVKGGGHAGENAVGTTQKTNEIGKRSFKKTAHRDENK